MWAERLYDDIEVGTERVGGPGGPVGFGDEAGDLAEDVLAFGELADASGPGFEDALANRGLAM